MLDKQFSVNRKRLTPLLVGISSQIKTRLRWALIGVLRTFWGSHLGASHTQVGVVHLQGLEPWTP